MSTNADLGGVLSDLHVLNAGYRNGVCCLPDHGQHARQHAISFQAVASSM